MKRLRNSFRERAYIPRAILVQTKAGSGGKTINIDNHEIVMHGPAIKGIHARYGSMPACRNAALRHAEICSIKNKIITYESV